MGGKGGRGGGGGEGGRGGGGGDCAARLSRRRLGEGGAGGDAGGGGELRPILADLTQIRLSTELSDPSAMASFRRYVTPAVTGYGLVVNSTVKPSISVRSGDSAPATLGLLLLIHSWAFLWALMVVMQTGVLAVPGTTATLVKSSGAAPLRQMNSPGTTQQGCLQKACCQSIRNGCTTAAWIVHHTERPPLTMAAHQGSPDTSTNWCPRWQLGSMLPTSCCQHHVAKPDSDTSTAMDAGHRCCEAATQVTIKPCTACNRKHTSTGDQQDFWTKRIHSGQCWSAHP